MKVHLHIISCVILIVTSSTLFSQSLDIGLMTGTNVFRRAHAADSSFFTSNGNLFYKERSTGSGVINKNSVFNAYMFGVISNFSWKRYTVNAEMYFANQRTVYHFEQPYEVNRIIGTKSFRLPVYVTYKFFKSANSPYLLAGLTFNAEKNTDIQGPSDDGNLLGGKPIYYATPDFGDYHLYGLLYDEHPYWYSTLGLGIRTKNLNWSLRFNRPINSAKRNVIASHWQVEFHIGIYLLSTKDFTKKHYLYVDEE